MVAQKINSKQSLVGHEWIFMPPGYQREFHTVMLWSPHSLKMLLFWRMKSLDPMLLHAILNRSQCMHCVLCHHQSQSYTLHNCTLWGMALIITVVSRIYNPHFATLALVERIGGAYTRDLTFYLANAPPLPGPHLAVDIGTFILQTSVLVRYRSAFASLVLEYLLVKIDWERLATV